MKQINKIFRLILFAVIGTIFFIPILPIIIISMPFFYFQRKRWKKYTIRFEKKYYEFLKKNNGKNFFCYNNQKSSKKYIEDQIIPNLIDEIEIVYLNGKKVESEYNVEFIVAALYKLKNYSRFPHLMKIRNGNLIDKSINNSFYGVMNLNKHKNELLTQINQFFELNQIKNVD